MDGLKCKWLNVFLSYFEYRTHTCQLEVGCSILGASSPMREAHTDGLVQEMELRLSCTNIR